MSFNPLDFPEYKKNELNPFDLLNKLKIRPNKRLGQNFLKSKALINKMLSLSEITEDDIILEIGAGLGFLTKALAEKAKKIYAVEIDTKLCEYLMEEMSSFKNIKIINDDILKIDIPKCSKVVSNIPFSISGPILEKVFFTENPPQGIMTIETKLADRIFFKGGYKDFSRITISVNSFMVPSIHLKYFRNFFAPAPKIDVSLIKLLPKKNIHPFLKETKTRNFYLNFIKGIMPYKNKNLLNAIELYFHNNLHKNLSKKTIIDLLADNKYKNNKLLRYKINDFIEISKLVYNLT